MKPIITCKQCGATLSIEEALLDEIKTDAFKELSQEHQAQLLEREKEVRAELQAKAEQQLKEREQKSALAVEQIKLDAEQSRKDNQELREQLKEVMQQLRDSKKAEENAELEMQKKLVEEEGKIREEAEKSATEKQRLIIAEREKTITDLKKSLDEAQRKAAQGSQQLQGEVMELDIEAALTEQFRDDEIVPIEKGKKGADVQQIVKDGRGNTSGIILWEIKRTKGWNESWVQKLKDDVRASKAHIPVIISEIMPKTIQKEIAQYNGVWVVQPKFVMILADLLRKNVLDVSRQKAIAENRDSTADALYQFVTGHEFSQQVQAMVEVYLEMISDIVKEKAAFERLWAKREQHANRLLSSTSQIIGSMQGQIGEGAMPKIKGLDLLEEGVVEKQ